MTNQARQNVLRAIQHARWLCDQPVTEQERLAAARALGIEHMLPEPEQLELINGD